MNTCVSIQVDFVMDQRVSPPTRLSRVRAGYPSALALDEDGSAKPRRGRWLKWAALGAVLVGGGSATAVGLAAARAVTVTYTTTPAAARRSYCRSLRHRHIAADHQG